MVGEQPDDDLRAPDVVIPMDDGVHDRLPEALNRNNSGSHGNRRRPSWKPSRSEETPRDTSAPGRSATAAARLRPLSGPYCHRACSAQTHVGARKATQPSFSGRSQSGAFSASSFSQWHQSAAQIVGQLPIVRTAGPPREPVASSDEMAET